MCKDQQMLDIQSIYTIQPQEDQHHHQQHEMEKISQTMDKVSETMDKVSQTMGNEMEKISQTMDKVSETMDKVSQTMGKVCEVLNQQLMIIKNMKNSDVSSKQAQMMEQNILIPGLGVHRFLHLSGNEKNEKLIDLLSKLKDEKAIVFVKSAPSCVALCKLLNEHHFTAVGIHRQMKEDDRLQGYKQFKEFETRILVSTDFFDLNMDIASANIVFNYHMPDNPKTYLHRVGGADRLGTKGLAITFVADENDAAILDEVRNGFNIQITEMLNEFGAATSIKNH